MSKKNRFEKKGWTPEQLDSLLGKTYVITGATSGAGFEATRILLSKGAKVVMLNRNSKKSKLTISMLKEEFGNDVKASFINMDLASLSSVREAASIIIDEVPYIDALMCNAAIAQVATQKFTQDGFESQLGVNHLGHFLLCGLLFERIEESKGRIVVVGSNGYKMGEKRIKFEDFNFDEKYTPWASYAQSKLGQMMFAYELQRRIKKLNKKVQVQVCHPGASRTNLIQDTAGPIQKRLWAVLSIFAQSAERGAWPEVMCATEDNLEDARYYGPTRFEMVGPVGECKLHDCALDKVMAVKLWELSEEKTGFKWSLE
jgi:NAD(P)-dependent dehydrogenase (short-subunit alcohol dehydrogenase family)